VSAISKAAKNYYGENAVLKNFPITISLPDKNNVLKLENAENIYGYVKINEDGKVELIVNIKDNTYLKNYNNANAFNLNDSKYVYEGSSKQWIVSKYNPSKLILWKPIENNIGIQSLVDEYIFLSYYYYTELESSFVNTASFHHDITKGKDIDETMNNFINKYRSYLFYIPDSIKKEVNIKISKMKERFGASVTDATLVPYETMDAFFNEIKDSIPKVYNYSYGANGKLDLSDSDIMVVIPSKVDGVPIKKIANYSCASEGIPDYDCENFVECNNLYSGVGNYFYNLVISNGIEEIGSSYFNNKMISKLALPSTIKKINNLSFSNNEIQELILPNSLTWVGASAFTNNKIHKLTLSNSLTFLGNFAFNNNKITGKIKIPSSLKNISVKTFSSNKIDEVDIPEGVTSIKASAFNTNNIKEVIIPSTVIEIGNSAFLNNPITKVTIKGDAKRFNSNWTEIGFPESQMPK
ncbi:MAG: leucine-rich repeat domain-containing protein, partial [Bacilli bacterium]